MRRLLALAGLLALVPTGTAAAAPAGQEHLPDLRALAPSDLSIEVSGEQRFLRFTTTIANGGNGPVELRPENSGTQTAAFQRILTHDAAGVWSVARETNVGTFVFHPEHHHWHFEGFARNELRNVSRTGGIGKRVRSASEKVSFCMLDSRPQDTSLEHAPASSVYRSCPEDGIQGISVGWTDVYPSYLAGQSLDVTGLRGDFWLVITADPLDRLEETSDTNNVGAVKIRINRRVRILEA
jgi:lysyl oxidase